MATAAELEIIIEAQDRASAHLRQIGQEVQRLERQVEGVRRSSGAGGGLLGGLQVGAGLQAAQAAFGALGGAFRFVRESVVDLNAQLERTQASYEGVTRNAGAAADLLAIVREEAGRGFDLSQMQQAGRQLITFAEGSRDRFRELLQLVQQLNAADPSQNLESAGFALREALSGDFQSLIERFEVSRAAIQRWREQGLSNLEVVQRAIESVGGSSEAVERLGRTFESRLTVLQSFGNELRQLVGAGLFSQLNDLLGRAVALLAQYGEQLRTFARAVGAALAGVVERAAAAVSGPLRALMDALAPGLWEQLAAGMARMPEAVAQTGRAAERAAPLVRDLTRDLARAGVSAAEIQLQSDRLRRAYEDQLGPLERQLRLLEQSADLQRIQAGLATNRATQERLRLQAEVGALQRAAGGATDPGAAGLTSRQRAIALALQERQLRLQELDLEEERRPLVQSLREQIAAIQEQQRQALEPLERQLATYRDQVAALQLLRQQQELVSQDAVAAADATVRAWTDAGGAEAVAAAKQRGEALAQSWADGFQQWIDAGGGTLWGAIKRSLDKWYAEEGEQAVERVGKDLGTVLGTAIGGTIGPALSAELRKHPLIQWLEQQGQGRAGAGAGAVLPTLDPVVRARSGLPAVTAGGPNVSVNVDVQAVGALTEAQVQAMAEDAARRLAASLAAAAAGTDPGPNALVQGAGR